VGEGLLLGILALGGLQAPATGDCLRYEPAVSEPRGRIERAVRPGVPNFEDIRKGDQPETIWILRLARPVCVVPVSPSDDRNSSEKDVREIQLVLSAPQYKLFAPLAPREVKVRGPLFHAHTGHHHTQVLQTVKQMESVESRTR